MLRNRHLSHWNKLNKKSFLQFHIRTEANERIVSICYSFSNLFICSLNVCTLQFDLIKDHFLTDNFPFLSLVEGQFSTHSGRPLISGIWNTTFLHSLSGKLITKNLLHFPQKIPLKLFMDSFRLKVSFESGNWTYFPIFEKRYKFFWFLMYFLRFLHERGILDWCEWR